MESVIVFLKVFVSFLGKFRLEIRNYQPPLQRQNLYSGMMTNTMTRPITVRCYNRQVIMVLPQPAERNTT